MADPITVDIKQAKREMFRIRGKFLKLQRSIVGEALEEAARPIAQAAAAAAPTLTGRLRERIGFSKAKHGRAGRWSIGVGPIRQSKGDKLFPFYGRFQELGWKATGRATRKTAKNPRQISGKHFLRNAGAANFSRAEAIFSARVFAKFAEVQAGIDESGAL